jgi:hypothetical protein
VIAILSGYINWLYLGTLVGLVVAFFVWWMALFVLYGRKSKREPYKTFYEIAYKWDALEQRGTTISGAIEARKVLQKSRLTEETMAAIHSYCNNLAVFKFQKFIDEKSGATQPWTISDKYDVLKEIVVNLPKYIRPEIQK